MQSAPATDTDRKAGRTLLAVTIAVVVATFLLRLLLSAASGLSFDEGLYAFWSQHPSAGYLNHPPMVAWWMAVGRLLGTSEFTLRLVNLVATLGVTLLVYRIGLLLFGRTVAALATIALSLTFGMALGFLATPDVPSMLSWTAIVWVLAEARASGRQSWWLAAGLFGGLGLLSKYTLGLLVPGLLLYVLFDREARVALKSPAFWLSPFVALLAFLPNLLWNLERGFAGIAFQGRRTIVEDASWQRALGYFGEFLGGQAIFIGPPLLVLAVMGLIAGVRGRESGARLLALTSLPALLYFLFHLTHSRVQLNWLFPLWPVLALLGAAAFCRLAGRTQKIIGFAQLVLSFAPVLIFSVQLLWAPLDIGDRDRTDETRGWPALVAELSQLATANGTATLVIDARYEPVGEIASHVDLAGLPLRVVPGRQPERWDFLPAEPVTGPVLLVWRIGEAPEGVAPLATFTRQGAHDPLESYGAALVSEWP